MRKDSFILTLFEQRASLGLEEALRPLLDFGNGDLEVCFAKRLYIGGAQQSGAAGFFAPIAELSRKKVLSAVREFSIAQQALVEEGSASELDEAKRVRI